MVSVASIAASRMLNVTLNRVILVFRVKLKWLTFIQRAEAAGAPTVSLHVGHHVHGAVTLCLPEIAVLSHILTNLSLCINNSRTRDYHTISITESRKKHLEGYFYLRNNQRSLHIKKNVISLTHIWSCWIYRSIGVSIFINYWYVHVYLKETCENVNSQVRSIDLKN